MDGIQQDEIDRNNQSWAASKAKTDAENELLHQISMAEEMETLAWENFKLQREYLRSREELWTAKATKLYNLRAQLRELQQS